VPEIFPTLTQELDQLVLPFHGFNLRLVFRLIFLNARPSPVLGGPLEDFLIVEGIIREFSSVGLFAVVVEGGIGVVKFSTGRVATFVNIILSVFFA
jgi:hypothetical protein